MKPFLRKILGATRLTSQGKLADATAAIQRALAQAGAHTAERSTRSGAAAKQPEPVGSVVVDEPDVIDMPEFAAPPRRAATTVEESTVDEAPPAARERGGRFVESSFTAAAGTRTFKLFVPSGFDGDALPLVVMLHGCTQDP